MPYTAPQRKNSTLAVFSVLFGLVFSMTGVLYASVGKVTRFSDPQVILVLCSLIGLGLVLILAGVNIAAMNKSSGRSRSFLAGILFSVLGIFIFVTYYPEGWFYPIVAYAIISYSLGIFLILLNIFVNCFTLPYYSPSCTSPVTGLCNEDLPENKERSGSWDNSVMARFAGILLANNILPDQPGSIQDDDDNESNGHIVSDLQSKPDEVADSYALSRIIVNHEAVNVGSGAAEEKPAETVQEAVLPDEPASSQAAAVQPASENEEAPAVADSPFNEFISMKKTNIKPSDTMLEAARKLLMFQFGRMLEHERGTQVGKDIEELHDMRVAAMRMRSVFQVLEEYLDMKALDKHLNNLRSTRRALGQVRDLDVFLEKIDHYLENHPTGIEIDLSKLTDSLHIEKAKRRGMMLIYMDSARYGKFKNSFTRVLLEKRSWAMKQVTKKGEPIPGTVKDVLPVLLYSRFSRVRSYDHIVSAEASPTLEQYHQLRIDVKILRYTLEFFREVLGAESKELIQDLKNLQDNLGDMHDAAVALELLENFERYGRWGMTEEDHVKAQAIKDPGVEAYMQYRREELKRLIAEFPTAWSKVIDNDFSITFSRTIAGMYAK
ncbi:MAG: CHAD domain-containing protein [Methanolobus sp.]|uniref:CHAD domain-containing protein n=1 Tax=Methanolobus sp. TaxID=1874737 RepID=UPI0027304FBB|nr:CHAD domain-containing protein [Methanolobus sp.]MDP2216317.1 CHAD domain-containing protein [Methanolobus sp.]